MRTVPISEARRRWGEVARIALSTPVLLTRHGRPWVLVLPVSPRLGALVHELPTERHRAAGRHLCRVASAVAGGAILVVIRGPAARVVLMPAGVSQNLVPRPE